MAISPEVRPRVSVTTDYEAPAMRTTATESRKDRLESSSDNSIGYALIVIALIVAGYFAYMYYGQNTVVPSMTDQSTTIILPPVVPPVAAPAPSATTPVVPVVPVAPATPPAATTTP